jgi:hypothetical protein
VIFEVPAAGGWRHQAYSGTCACHVNQGPWGEDVVHLYDCSYDVMVCLMEYLYTDQIEISSVPTPLSIWTSRSICWA